MSRHALNQDATAAPVVGGRPNREKIRYPDRIGTYQCDCCGLEFLAYRKKADRVKKHYCTLACHRADRRGPKNSNWRGGVSGKVCGVCEKPFTPKIPTSKQVCCSAACRREWVKKYPNARVANREHGRRREARERGGKAIKTHTYEQWLDLCTRSKWRCAACRKKVKLTRDHIIPLSKGGHDGIENIQPLCFECNRQKGAKICFLC